MMRCQSSAAPPSNAHAADCQRFHRPLEDMETQGWWENPGRNERRLVWIAGHCRVALQRNNNGKKRREIIEYHNFLDEDKRDNTTVFVWCLKQVVLKALCSGATNFILFTDTCVRQFRSCYAMQ